MNVKTRSIGILIFVIVPIIASFAPGDALSGDLFSVSVKNIVLARGERIANFELSVKAGRIYSLSHVPWGWEIYIDNQPSWNTRVSGGVVVGAAGLYLDFFEEEFLVIEKDADDPQAFRIELVLYVTTNFEDVRPYVVDGKNIVLKKKLASVRTKDK